MREQHVGYYLIAEGRPQLEKIIQFHPSVRGRFLVFIRRNATFLYLEIIVFLTILIASAIVFFAIYSGASLAQIMATAILSIIPVSAVSIDFVNWLVVALVPPRSLPKLNLETGVPAEYRTMVVIPALLGTKRDIAFLIRQIELHFVANNDPNVFFALLTDFADAPEKQMPADNELIAEIADEIDRLNEKYGHAELPPLLPVPPGTDVESQRGMLDGLGEKTRQTGGI